MRSEKEIRDAVLTVEKDFESVLDELRECVTQENPRIWEIIHYVDILNCLSLKIHILSWVLGDVDQL